MIKGDLDSLRTDVREFYEAQVSSLQEWPQQQGTHDVVGRAGQT